MSISMTSKGNHWIQNFTMKVDATARLLPPRMAPKFEFLNLDFMTSDIQHQITSK